MLAKLLALTPASLVLRLSVAIAGLTSGATIWKSMGASRGSW